VRPSSNDPDSEEYKGQWDYQHMEGWVETADPDCDYYLDMQKDDGLRMVARIRDKDRKRFTRSKRSHESKKPLHKHEPAVRVQDELDFLEYISLVNYPVYLWLEGRLASNDDQYATELEYILKDMNVTEHEAAEIMAEVKKWRAEWKASPQPVSSRIPLSAIHHKPEIYSYDDNKIDWLPDRLNRVLEYRGKDDIRREFFPVRLFKHENTYWIVDGYHRWKAYERRKKLIDRQQWNGPYRENERGASALTITTTIPAVVFRMPKRKPKKGQYLLRTYELEGKNITQAVEEIAREKAGLPWGRIATLLKIDQQTAKKYAEPIIKAWGVERDAFIRRLKDQGLTVKGIEAKCILRWPWGYGISQAAVSRISRARRP